MWTKYSLHKYDANEQAINLLVCVLLGTKAFSAAFNNNEV